MSTHIAAKEGQIAQTVLLPGDPLRAQFIAETFLEGAECYNKVRGMFGFTGTYKRKTHFSSGNGYGAALAVDLRERTVSVLRRAKRDPRGNLRRRPYEYKSARRYSRFECMYRFIFDDAALRFFALCADCRL